MRLLEAYVENFGTLSGYNIDFNKDLTVLKEDNGFGKTTLAAFIKAMLYGQPVSRKKALEENPREFYKPWQGGNYGGTLTFEEKGKTYRIERFFTDKNETFKLINMGTGLETDDFSEDLGIELFGIDAESFERSIFIPQSAIGTSMNTDVRARLTGIMESGDDLGSYDNAEKLLTKTVKQYTAGGKNKGVLTELSSKKLDLERVLKDSVAAEENLKFKTAQRDTITAEQGALEKEQGKIKAQLEGVAKAEALAEKLRAKEDITARLLSAQNRLDALNAVYPNGLPTQEELSVAEQNADYGVKLSTEAEVLNKQLANGDELSFLKGFFKDQEVTDEQLNKVRELLARQSENEIKLKTLGINAYNTTDSTPEKSGIATNLLPVFAVLMLAGGVVGIIASALAVGLILIAAGIVLLGAFGFIYLKNMISSGKAQGINTKELAELSAKLKAENEISKRETDGFFAKFPSVTRDLAGLETIVRYHENYERAKAEATKFEQKLLENAERTAGVTAELNEFFGRFGIGYTEGFGTRLGKIRNDIATYKTVNAELSALNQKLTEYEDVRTDEQGEIGVSLDELQKADRMLTEKIGEKVRLTAQINAEISYLSEMADRRTEIEDELSSVTDSYNEAIAEVDILTQTLELLSEAKTSLSGKYLGKMTAGFKKYADILNGDTVGKVMIDTDLSLDLERYGSLKDKESFSAGYKDMLDIAVRLALADAMYDGVAPIIILDDPFVNLDDTRLENALELLKKLAEERQIIYLTCHSSRC